MYTTGDRIIHPRYGAGIIKGETSYTLYGKMKHYHVLELIGERGEVMIPIKFADEMDIRPAIKNMETIEEVFGNQPNELSDNYRTRQAKIDHQIKTREPRAMAQALRDLAWREHVHKLTGVEQKMKNTLIKMLSHEMAVIQPNLTVAQATNRLTAMLVNMIEYHQRLTDIPAATS